MGVLIAGTGSGSGKTTVSIGIMAALTAAGDVVQPFKVGPDYIDPDFHEFVTGAKSHNLDSFMLNTETVRYLYSHYAAGKVAIIEGVMGMYDGVGSGYEASSAHIAALTKTPVILVIDGKGLSTSAAAIVKGFAEFSDEVEVAGVIVNRVSGQAHYDIIRKAVEQNTGIECLGFLPKTPELALPSRHLGLIPSGETEKLSEVIALLKNLVQEHINLERIREIALSHQPEKQNMPAEMAAFIAANASKFKGKRIGVALDKAFNFYYEANLDLLESLGADLVAFSPLEDEKLPASLDALYLGGGFPEVFAEQLSNNKSFIADIRSYLESGGRCYAECGGFIYLARSIQPLGEAKSDMVGLFDTDCIMTRRLQRFGYVTVNYEGIKMKAHEFHHSRMTEELHSYRYLVQKYRDGKLKREWRCGAEKGGTLAGYPHMHFWSNPEFARRVFLGV